MGHPCGASDGETTVNRDNGCYVKISNAPLQVWHAWDRGNYPAYKPAIHSHLFQGRMIRLGSYGDPVAAPLSAFKPILALARGHYRLLPPVEAGPILALA